MLTVEEALELVRTHAKQLAPRRVSLAEASGLVLAEDIASDVDSPPYNKALMDGYAVRSADREPQRQILEEIPAGAVPRVAIAPGTASRIMTGAPLPEGADAVIPLEQTELQDEHHVRLAAVVSSGANILRAGASLRIGDVVLRAGALLRPIEIAVLAELGRTTVCVVPQPRLAVLPTGNELVPLGDKPGIGQISNSNGPMLVAMATTAGAHATELEIARDDPDELKQFIDEGLRADVLVLSGGVSAGKFDLVPNVLESSGVAQVFHKISLRPGKPLWFGIKQEPDRQSMVFALPGNPVSSLVCFELFVRPAISALSGRGFAESKFVAAKLGHAFHHTGGRVAYLPALLELDEDGPRLTSTSPDASPLPTVEILPWQGSADIATLTRANALAIFGTERVQLEPGATINVIPI